MTAAVRASVQPPRSERAGRVLPAISYGESAFRLGRTVRLRAVGWNDRGRVNDSTRPDEGRREVAAVSPQFSTFRTRETPRSVAPSGRLRAGSLAALGSGRGPALPSLDSGRTIGSRHQGIHCRRGGSRPGGGTECSGGAGTSHGTVTGDPARSAINVSPWRNSSESPATSS
jgi:hypothetical protein